MAGFVAGEQAVIRVIYLASFDALLIPELIALESASTPFPWTISMLEGSLISTSECQRICKGDETIGYWVVQCTLEQAEILNIVIFEKFQSQGYGYTTIRKLQENLIQTGVKKLFLEVRESNLAAQALYTKTGFERVGIRRGYYRALSQDESAEDAWLMACELGAKAYS